MNVIEAASIIGLKVLKFATVATASTMLIASTYTAWDMYHTEQAAFSSYDLSQYRPQVENGEPATLDEVETINNDACAWLTIYNTNIDYPVPQGKDDLEYVNKDIYGNATPTGAIYLATQNNPDFSDSYNLMYGHHMDNGAMFGDVDKFLDSNFFHSHTKGILITSNQVYDLTLVGSLETVAQDNIVYQPKRTGLGILDYLKSKAIQYNDAGNISKILALSTCDYDRTNGRDVAFFSMTPHEGDYEQYDILDNAVPLSGHGDYYWALLNLLCVIVTVYNFIPIHIIFSKYKRKHTMNKRNSLFETERESTIKEHPNGDKLYDISQFGRKTLIGIIMELILAIGAVVTFFYTEDIRLPVRMIDKWTPLMLLFLFAIWIVDVVLMRLNVYENKEEYKEELVD